MPSIFIIPTAHGWNFLRAAEQNGSWNVRKLQTLEEAAPLLAATDDFVLGLPVSRVSGNDSHPDREAAAVRG